MSVSPTSRWLAVLLLACASSVQAQAGDRIWGEVYTTSDEQYEGFIRWDRNEASWADILNGSKEIPEETYLAWLDALKGGERPMRFIDLMGYRVSWDEEDPDFPSSATSGIRFGHIAGLKATGADEVELTLRSGERVTLSGGSTDIGNLRELLVDDPEHGEIELEWTDLDRIVFLPVPEGARPASPRLYGTVEDRDGRQFIGWISWDLDEVLGTDVLDGEEDDGKDHEIEFSEIRAIEKSGFGARVTLVSGEALELDGTNDVDDGHRGVQISDPALGMIEVEWDDFARIDFQDPPPALGYDAYDGGHRLFGTVVSQAGDETRGRVRWDADEQWSWELLNGSSRGIRFSIDFGQIRRIERADPFGAFVTLVDGRTFELDDSNDVDWDNKGIFIERAPEDQADQPTDSSWQFVSWEDFLEVRFEHPTAPPHEDGVGPASPGRRP